MKFSNRLCIAILGAVICLSTEIWGSEEKGQNTSDKANLLLNSCVVPVIKFDDEPLERALEFIRIKVLDFSDESEEWNRDCFIDFINRSRVHGKTVKLHKANLSVTKILEALATENGLLIRISESQIFVYDRPTNDLKSKPLEFTRKKDKPSR